MLQRLIFVERSVQQPKRFDISARDAGAAAITPKPLLGVILLLSAVRFPPAAALQYGAGRAVNEASGAVGLLTGVFAVYGGLGLLLEDTRQRADVPVFRFGAAKQPWRVVWTISYRDLIQ